MVAMAKKRDIKSDNRKYGFPVSGRVPEGAANKIREEALKSGLSMSKMISLIVSEWANGEDTRANIIEYVDKNNNLKVELKGKNAEISKLRKQLDKQKKLNSKWESHCSEESDRINRVWNESVVEMFNEIASSKSEQKQLAQEFKSIFKSKNR